MFYCEKCQVKNNWPQGFSGSYGPCEFCGSYGKCFDVSSKFLPVPEPKKNEELWR